MSLFLDDLLELFRTQGIGTPNSNMFASSKASIPTGNGPYLSVTETGGSGQEGTHNDSRVGKNGYEQPNAQIICRAVNYNAAKTMAVKAHAAIVKVGSKSQMVNGTWWRSAKALQQPFDLGSDAQGRPQVVFNIAVVKRPETVA